MRYKSAFRNDYLEITVNTNSKKISGLIDNFMDFDNSSGSTEARIRIAFHLNERTFNKRTEDRKFIYGSKFLNNSVLSFVLKKTMAEVTVDLESGTVRGVVSGYEEMYKERTLDFLLMQPIRFVLARHGFFFLHASMVTRDSKAILVCGPRDSGKSTLALTLAENGFEFASDDDCFIKKAGNNVLVFPFPTKIGLNEKFLKRHPALVKQVVTDYSYGGKERLSFYQKRAAAKGRTCRAIIFAGYSAHDKLRIKEIGREAAMKRLLKERLVIYPERESRDLIWTFYALAKKTPSFELAYNDGKLDQIPRIVKRLTGL